MIITISGTAGSGKSTVGKLLAKKLGYKHYSMGDLQRQIAQQRNITLVELQKLEEKDPSIDQDLDQMQVKLGEKEDNFVIDGRLSFHFIPNSLKIFLDSDLEIRAKRIFTDKISDRSTEKNISLEDTKQKMKEREDSEIKRYKKYYNLNPYDKTNYDLICDASEMTIEENANVIIKFIIKEQKNQ
ncbi:MAG: (d)CMP kinase [Candidatus Woesearchaeota archaeon]